MGILDRIRGGLGGSRRPDPALGPQGPLGLAVGDVVRYYSEQFVVSGHRSLDGDGRRLHHYCLRNEQGDWVVLAIQEDDDGYWLERTVETPVPAGGSVAGLTDEPLRLAHQANFRCRTAGDTGVPPARTVQVEEYEDEEGENRLVIEKHDGRRIARLGDPVHEGELSFDGQSEAGGDRPWATVVDGMEESRADDGDAGDDLEPGDDPALPRVKKGTAMAAAMALEGRLGSDENQGALEVVEDFREGYADDDWADDDDDARATESLNDVRRLEDGGTLSSDNWLAASYFPKGSGKEYRQDDDWLSD